MRTFEDSLRIYDLLVQKDFENMIKNLKSYKFESYENKDFKNLHKSLFSLFSLIEEIHIHDGKNLQLLNEIRSDLIELITALCYGLKRSSFLCMRSSIEHLFLHIFYNDHPIEYLLFKNAQHRLTFEDLCKYTLKYPTYANVSHIINKIINEYKKKSESIHAASDNTFQNMKIIDQVRMSNNDAIVIIRDSLKIIDCVKVLIIILHKNIFDYFDAEKKRIYVNQLSKKNRNLINNTKFID